MTVQNMSKTQLKWKKLRDGIATALPAGSDVLVDTQKYTQAQLLAKIDPLLAAFTAAASAKTQATSAVAALHALILAEQPFRSPLVNGLRAVLGEKSPLLELFGIAPRKVRLPRTAAQKAAAAAKAAATRKARGVMSKKQRAQIPAAPASPLLIDGQGRPMAQPTAVAPAPAQPLAPAVASSTAVPPKA